MQYNMQRLVAGIFYEKDWKNKKQSIVETGTSSALNKDLKQKSPWYGKKRSSASVLVAIFFSFTPST